MLTGHCKSVFNLTEDNGQLNAYLQVFISQNEVNSRFLQQSYPAAMQSAGRTHPNSLLFSVTPWNYDHIVSISALKKIIPAHWTDK